MARRSWTRRAVWAALAAAAAGGIARALFLAGFQSTMAPRRLVLNPYEGIDWPSVTHHRANLHTHTTESDGSFAPAEVIDTYKEAGYTILALTDHDTHTEGTTWPWSRFGRDPEALDMVAVQGNELSRGHHRGSYFNDLAQGNENEDASIRQVAERGGLAVLLHPGRYTRISRHWRSFGWYLDIYRKHPETLIGLEVYNQNNRYKGDRRTWDRVLGRLMPERPVWGFANDDTHRSEHFFRSYNTFPLAELSSKAVREAMEEGSFFFSYEPGRSGKGLAPKVAAIEVDETAGTITVRSPDALVVEWVSNGRVVSTGESFDYRNAPKLGRYVRAQLIGEHGRTYTQPFGLASIE